MTSRPFAILAAAVIGMLPATAARAQWYSSYPQQAPAYPSGAPAQQPYAVEVAPNTYVIHRPAKPRADVHVRCVKDCDQPAAERPRRTHADRALIEELVKRNDKRKEKAIEPAKIDSTKVINTTKVVREKPVVIEHKRVVDDPPRIIERRRITEDTGRGLIRNRRVVGEEEVVVQPGGPGKVERNRSAKLERPAKTKRPAHEASGKRVIDADAEITILGPDRMSIRLFRKRRGSDANAEVVQ